MITNLYDLYIHQIKDLHSAETQIIGAMPKMIAMAQTDEVRDELKSHLEETREQLNRINTILGNRNERAGDDVCEATKGLIKEGEHLMKEMAAYGTAKQYAQNLDFDDDVDLLDEESDANEKFTKLATGGFFSSGANQMAAAMS
ncbi:MAG: DUF892 family protein [Verrucomicrobiales bacterium]